MDVNCPRCKTDYEFDDARVPDAGVTVKCTSCGHVFRVRKKSVPPPAALQTKPSDATEPFMPRTAPPQREWKVRQPSGNVFSFKELTTLQKWIVERKVSRDDEISLTGESWKRLGNIAELASFFQVVDEAKKVQELEALQAAEKLKPPPPPPPSAPPPDELPRAASQSGSVPAPGERAGLQQIPAEATAFPGRGRSLHEAPTLPPDDLPNPKRKLTETLRDPAFVMPPPRAAEERPPPFRAPPPPPQRVQPPPPPPPSREVPSELAEIQAREDARQLKQTGGAGKWIGLLLVLLGIGGAAGWYFVVYAPEQARLKELADIQARAKSDEEARQREEETRKAAEEQRKKDEAAKAAAAVAVTAVVDAGVPDAGAVLAETPDKTDKTAKKDEKTDKPDKKDEKGEKAEKTDKKDEKKGCKNVDCWIAQGDRLRDRERAEAALDAYGKALDLKPDNIEALTGKGLCFLDMAKPVLAEPVLEQALKISPRYAPAIMGLAESYRFQGKKEAAIGMYQKYLDNFPNGPEANVAKSNIDRLR